MDRRTLLLASSVALLATRLRAQAVAVPPMEVQIELPGARLQGSARLRFFGLHIYDARLWVESDYPLDSPAREDFMRHDLLLEIQYARALAGKTIAERSLEEMERSGPLDKATAQSWLTFMVQTFPNVVDGTRLSALQKPSDAVRFFVDGKAAGELRDSEFARRFFGIWLSPLTSQPQMRQQLLGGTA
jgi:hypothetical protein